MAFFTYAKLDEKPGLADRLLSVVLRPIALLLLPRPRALFLLRSDGSVESRLALDAERVAFPDLILLLCFPQGRHWWLRAVPQARVSHLQYRCGESAEWTPYDGLPIRITHGMRWRNDRSGAHFSLFPDRLPTTADLWEGL